MKDRQDGGCVGLSKLPSPDTDKIENNAMKQAGTNVNTCDWLSEVTGYDDHSD
jgi:hypothetical protein